MSSRIRGAVVCVCTGVAVWLATGAAHAQSATAPQPRPLTADPIIAPAWDNGAQTVPLDAAAQVRLLMIAPQPKPRRPSLLVPMYLSFGGLQAYDLSLTLRGTRPGGTTREGNPVIAGFAGNAGAMVALKSASTVSAVILTERLWKNHRRAAVALMTTVNAAMALVVAHNQRLVR